MSEIKEKSLVIYFSRSGENYAVGYIDKGNTEVIAEYIRDITNADLFKTEPAKPYSSNYKQCCREALEEKKQNIRPKLKNYLTDISEYKTIYIGFPIYFGTMPACMLTQLEKLDFTGKNIKVFTTHEGSGLGNAVADVKNVCKGADVTDSIAIQGKTVYSAKAQIEAWINK